MGRIERRRFLLAASALVAAPRTAQAQQARRFARIGWLGLDDRFSVPFEGLRAGLRERGWVEGDNLVIEVRNGGFDDAQELTAQLVQARVQLIVAQGGMVFRARPHAGETPLVFHINGDPVELKIAASYAHPGGTLTGVTNLSAALSVKRVELLKEALPRMTRLAAIANQGHPGWRVELNATQEAAKRFGLALTWAAVYSAKDFERAFDTAAHSDAQGLVAIPDNLILSQARAIAGFGAKQRIPAISGWDEFAVAGNLLSYGAVLRDVYVKMAGYADRILRGAKPGDLPIENPAKFELVVNLEVARSLQLTLPQSLLVRADRVIG